MKHFVIVLRLTQFLDWVLAARSYEFASGTVALLQRSRGCLLDVRCVEVFDVGIKVAGFLHHELVV